MERLRGKLERALARQRTLVDTSVVNSHDPKAVFSYAICRLKAKGDLAAIRRQDGSLASDDHEKCEILRKHSAATYETITSIAPTPVIIPSGISLVKLADFDCFTVHRYLDRLPEKRSTTPEGIPASFYRRATTGLAVPLSLIFNRLLSEGKVPEMFRKAIIAPVHKSGDKSEPRCRE